MSTISTRISFPPKLDSGISRKESVESEQEKFYEKIFKKPRSSSEMAEKTKIENLGALMDKFV